VTLLIDASGGVLRYARLANGALSDVASVPHRGIEPDEWDVAFGDLSPAPRQVLVANGAGAVFALRFAEWVEQRWGVSVEFPLATGAAGGIHNAHAVPGSLPIDRWLGLLAARARVAGPLIVVVAGPTFSVDLVDAHGAHRGGYGLPGERLMREALYGQTSGVAAAALLDSAAVDGVFGVNTAGAVQQGARLALAALVDRLAEALATLGAAPHVLMTGGGADVVVALVRREVQLVPDLVLEGLAQVATGARA